MVLWKFYKQYPSPCKKWDICDTLCSPKRVGNVQFGPLPTLLGNKAYKKNVTAVIIFWYPVCNLDKNGHCIQLDSYVFVKRSVFP